VLVAHPLLAFVLAASLAAPASPRPAAEGFDALSRRAAAAREAGRLGQAIALYDRALELRPDWDEGQWYLGTLFYESGKHGECVGAFSRFLEVKPRSGPGRALRGLCAFEEGDHAGAAGDLQKAIEFGLGGNEELLRATRARLALALLKTGQFERAVEVYTHLARTSPESPDLLDEIGLLILREARLPSEIPEDRRALVREAGRAGYLHLSLRGQEAARAYAALVEAHPEEPWVHYAYGVFLLRTDSEKALAELRREVEVQPGNVMAHLEIAFERLVRGEYAQARPHAEKATELAPGLFASHHALGRVLVELGELEEGIRHLEEAARLAPESPEMHFALGRAYARAGRSEDAARARATFAELERRRREERVPDPPPGDGDDGPVTRGERSP
jgi:tetratricopeptide (TPR) repeat protein